MESPGSIAGRHPKITLVWPSGQPFVDCDDGRAMARAVVDAVREPVLLLDRDLRVVAANQAYCLTFKADRADVQGRPVRAVDGGRWDTPEVRAMLARLLSRTIAADCLEVEQDMPGLGRRTLVLHAREAFQEGRARRLILLAVEDVSERRVAERESARLLAQMQTLLLANQHQIANSLQIIASILLLKARSVQSQETRTHLENVHWRIMSVATVQQQLARARRMTDGSRSRPIWRGSARRWRPRWWGRIAPSRLPAGWTTARSRPPRRSASGSSSPSW